MKSVLTSIIAILFLVGITSKSFSQTCSVSTTNPNPTPNYGTSLAVNGGNGFSSTNTTAPQTFRNGSADQLTSPIYFYSTAQGAQTSVSFRVDLASASNPGAQITAYTIAILSGNPLQTVSCSQTTTLSLTTTATAYYFTISGISVPANRNFQIRLGLTVTGGGSNRDVVASIFAANATLAAPGAVLPVKFTTFDARTSSANTALNWKVASEENVMGYEVEKSIDGRNFTKIGFVNVTGTNSYSYSDDRTSPGVSYYRIKSVDADGKATYSAIVSLKNGRSSIVFKGFPSLTHGLVTLQHDAATSASTIAVALTDGRVVKTIVPATGTQQTIIDLSSAQPGVYFIRYNNGNGGVETVKIIKQ